jgi:hypothetical protein
MLSRCLLNRIQFVLCEAKVFPNGDRPIRAIQFKDRLVPVSDSVDLRRSMVVRINDYAKTRKPQDGEHIPIKINLNAWVIRAKHWLLRKDAQVCWEATCL